MMFDIRMDVAVMRMGFGEQGIARVRLRIIPVKQFAISPNLITVLADTPWRALEGQPLSHTQPQTLVEFELASHNRNCRAATNNHQS